MEKLRSAIDPEETNIIQGPTTLPGDQNRLELRCGMCGRINFVDEETINRASEATKAGLDNPFRCEICQQEYDDLAYEG